MTLCKIQFFSLGNAFISLKTSDKPNNFRNGKGHIKAIEELLAK